MAAGSTYTPIASYTFASAAANYTFSSIPSTYTDLVLISYRQQSVAGRFLLRFNGDTGANYSDTYISGQGTTGYSGRDSGTGYSAISMGGIWNGTTTTTWATNITHIFNYTNTTTYKTTLSRDANDKNGSGTVEAVVGLYRATPASITSLTVIASGGNFSIGTVMSLYGIAAA